VVSRYSLVKEWLQRKTDPATLTNLDWYSVKPWCMVEKKKLFELKKK